MNVLRNEPAVVLNVIGAVIALAVGFGAHISSAQVGLILAAVSAVLGVVIRSQVTPVAKTPPPTGSGATLAR